MNDSLRPFDTDHVKHSIGGFTGHALRRATHMVMALITLIFYARGVDISDYLGMNPDQLKPKERCASTSNRNFEGRQGRGGRTHLVSPGMAIAAAIKGRLTDVREI